MNFTIPGEPKGKGRPRFAKSGQTFTPKETASYENLVKVCYMEAAKEQGVEMIPADVPVEVYIVAAFGIPKSFSKAKRERALGGDIYPTKKPDCDNIIKIICDALNGIAYADDKQVVYVSCEKGYEEQPNVFVSIQEAKIENKS